MINPHKKPDELSLLLRSCSRYFVTAAIFSGAINLLYLAGPLYMLQVYDRVISSASEVTLVMLTIALLLAYIALAGLDMPLACENIFAPLVPRPEKPEGVDALAKRAREFLEVIIAGLQVAK